MILTTPVVDLDKTVHILASLDRKMTRRERHEALQMEEEDMYAQACRELGSDVASSGMESDLAMEEGEEEEMGEAEQEDEEEEHEDDVIY